MFTDITIIKDAVAYLAFCRWNDVSCESLASLVVEYGDSPQQVDPPQDGRSNLYDEL